MERPEKTQFTISLSQNFPAHLILWGISSLIIFSIIFFVFEVSIYRTTLCVGFICLGTLIMFISKVVYDDCFSPIGLMCFFWYWAVGLASLNISPVYQTKWSPQTWLVIVLSPVLFAAGSIFMLRYEINPTEWSFNNEEVIVRRIILLTWIVSASVFLLQISNVAIKSDLSVFLTEPFRARELFWIHGLGYLYTLNFLNFLLCIGFILRYGLEPMIVGILLFSSFTLPFHLVKTLIIMFTFGSFILSNYLRDDRYNMKQLLLFSLLPLIIFILYSLFTNAKTTEFIASGEVNFPSSLIIFLRPYLYIATNFANFQAALHDPNIKHTYGLRTIHPLLKATYISDFFNLDIRFREQRAVFGPGLNQNTYLGALYYDFGWGGVIIGPVLYGALTSYIYKIARQSEQIAAYAAYSIIAFMTAFSFFFNYFIKFYSWFFLITLLLIYFSVSNGDLE